jgi:hypothetical protein
MTIQDYSHQIKQWHFPRPKCCPECQGRNSFHRHGYYWRNLVTVDSEERIPILRFRCKFCQFTISILPSSLIPYFQYTVSFIITALHCIVSTAVYTWSQKFAALFRFYRRRFHHNMNSIEMFFREYGEDLARIAVIPTAKREKAIKLVCMLGTVPTAETFSQKFHQHNKRNFMAK